MYVVRVGKPPHTHLLRHRFKLKSRAKAAASGHSHARIEKRKTNKRVTHRRRRGR